MDRLMGLTPHRPSSVGSSLIIVNAQKIMVECAINIIANKKGAKMKLEKKMKTAHLQRDCNARTKFVGIFCQKRLQAVEILERASPHNSSKDWKWTRTLHRHHL